MYYIKRRDEGMHPEWGGDPVYWLELDQHGTCLRCLEEYPNGMVLSYDTSHPHDAYGDVPVMVMTPDEAPWWQEFFIDQATFEERWQDHYPLNRTFSPHDKEP